MVALLNVLFCEIRLVRRVDEKYTQIRRECDTGPKTLSTAYLDVRPKRINDFLDVRGPLPRILCARSLGIHENSHAISVLLSLQCLDPDDIILSVKRSQ